ncbi:gamma-glutamyltransferase [Roseimaritima ulvae]|uniref:Glutathione hydrolase proenzyme n=1 Tax=Roseimaritima ulvae TaxID=980254 RepID=A0A5B9QNE8_9BACT|nr:gamma-glutamyltransferase [Roseimaritima ulvae]QEG39005.1 Gamma-glutamyltranspeptidase precursor [Roseimaritima ulvae]
MHSSFNRRQVLQAAIGAAALAPLGRLRADAPELGSVDVSRTTGGVVSSNSAAASAVGSEVLADGGDAVDAAIAVALAMAVTWPEAGNIGGGGFMMVAPPAGSRSPIACIDYRETAPGAVTETTLANQVDRRHPRMVGVPGTVRGLALAHQRYGTLPWKRLVQPAVALAGQGVVVEAALADSINGVLNAVSQSPRSWHKPLQQTFAHPQGRPWQAGDVLKQPVLAATLQRIADNGPDEFYQGQTAEHLAKFFADNEGLITATDLQSYQAVVRSPIQTGFAGFDVWGPPPPSSGGLVLQWMLRMIEQVGLPDPGDAVWTPASVHVMAEAMRRAYRERAAHLGDPDFVEIPAELTTPAFATRLAASISRDQATDSRALAGDIPLSAGPAESPQTTHFSVVDAAGMAVANTYTLEASWGSWVMDPATGFVLNNEMGDFNWVPGYTDVAGRIGTAANLMAPGKRMLSSQTPTIVQRDGRTVLVTGSPGGRSIINTVLCILVQRLRWGRSLPEAIAAPRFSQTWLPDQLRIETAAGDGLTDVSAALQAMGHAVTPIGFQGAAHSIAVDPGSGVRTGVADWRRGGRVAVSLP